MDDFMPALNADRHIKEAKTTHANAHYTMTKLHEGEHEDSSTNIFKPNEMILRDDAPKFDTIAIPLSWH